ncbi:uncharacterized protein BDV14DRAFT_177814 [Aspergillus stella-maris]|uniref:uncharacterized protein n=1 Tax=Aspergillus stella-maris TaxID=1810926 RepID=UPI003CCDED1C
MYRVDLPNLAVYPEFSDTATRYSRDATGVVRILRNLHDSREIYILRLVYVDSLRVV